MIPRGSLSCIIVWYQLNCKQTSFFKLVSALAYICVISVKYPDPESLFCCLWLHWQTGVIAKPERNNKKRLIKDRKLLNLFIWTHVTEAYPALQDTNFTLGLQSNKTGLSKGGKKHFQIKNRKKKTKKRKKKSRYTQEWKTGLWICHRRKQYSLYLVKHGLVCDV